ncbi:hypothetical protein DP107_13510 [Haloglomus irregulare]|jgi:hypothetical protein|uniref:Uncharacterized protein n=1 Tax=Haloglomus irregulare TaxID=2234134 RepID=A0A554MZ04_9EURY|nr:hypothetical protein [Haloglomus irregulare]TSD10000.1 hypothetical protein DP107_13510 [Haloglomus irregulare]
MARSILGTLGLALTLAFALPVAYLGAEFLLDGRTVQGLLFLGLAALMVGVERYVTTPMDLPGEIAGRVLGGMVKEPSDEPDTADRGARPETGGGEATAPDDGGADGAADPGDDEVLIPDAESDRPQS